MKNVKIYFLILYREKPTLFSPNKVFSPFRKHFRRCFIPHFFVRGKRKNHHRFCGIWIWKKNSFLHFALSKHLNFKAKMIWKLMFWISMVIFTVLNTTKRKLRVTDCFSTTFIFFHICLCQKIPVSYTHLDVYKRQFFSKAKPWILSDNDVI